MSPHDDERDLDPTEPGGPEGLSGDAGLTAALELCQKGTSNREVGSRRSRPEQQSTMATPAEVKKALVEAGFEVYRTRGDTVHVAERVRENLIMDSNVRLRAADNAVRFAVRAQRSDFPDASTDQLFARVRSHAEALATSRGYAEVESNVTEVADPGDAERTIDTWCEVVFEKRVESLAHALDEVRFSLGIEKIITKNSA